MTDYDELFAVTAPEDSVFAAKGALDSLRKPEEVHAREEQERELATVLNGFHDGYLPPTVSIYGPPGTGKTLTVRRVCEEFAARTDGFAVEYVNLKDCRTLFSTANAILQALTGETKQSYEGLDGVFAAIWDALDDDHEGRVLILDEIDHIQYDSHYDHNDFFYRLLRGNERVERDVALSVFLISNELLEVDLKLDSRVRSAMSGEEICFSQYGVAELTAVLTPALERAFRDGALPDDVREYGIAEAAARWGDARKGLTLFRRAGETANAEGLARVTIDCIDRNLAETNKEQVIGQLLDLPEHHFVVLTAVVRRLERADDETFVTTRDVRAGYHALVAEASRLGARSLREIVDELDTMGLVETWLHASGEGREKRVALTVDPAWITDAYEPYLEASSLAHLDE